MTGRQERLLRVAAADAAGWSARGLPTLAAMTIEGRAGVLRSGTGFVVASRPDSVWILTARRLVVDSAGFTPIRIAIVLQGRSDAFLGRLVRMHDTADLALVAARIRGPALPAARFGNGAAVGAAAVVAGFPLGPDSLPAWRATGASATAVVATITAVEANQLVIATYGQSVPTGGPIYDAAGAVLGMVTDPPRGAAVPGATIRAFLRAVAPANPAQ
jgi:S1-C subfamily serine protease